MTLQYRHTWQVCMMRVCCFKVNFFVYFALFIFFNHRSASKSMQKQSAIQILILGQFFWINVIIRRVCWIMDNQVYMSRMRWLKSFIYQLFYSLFLLRNSLWVSSIKFFVYAFYLVLFSIGESKKLFNTNMSAI